jgi:hypothetical protein
MGPMVERQRDDAAMETQISGMAVRKINQAVNRCCLTVEEKTFLEEAHMVRMRRVGKVTRVDPRYGYGLHERSRIVRYPKHRLETCHRL